MIFRNFGQNKTHYVKLGATTADFIRTPGRSSDPSVAQQISPAKGQKFNFPQLLFVSTRIECFV